MRHKGRAVADEQAATISSLLVERQRMMTKIYNAVLTPRSGHKSRPVAGAQAWPCRGPSRWTGKLDQLIGQEETQNRLRFEGVDYETHSAYRREPCDLSDYADDLRRR